MLIFKKKFSILCCDTWQSRQEGESGRVCHQLQQVCWANRWAMGSLTAAVSQQSTTSPSSPVSLCPHSQCLLVIKSSSLPTHGNAVVGMGRVRGAVTIDSDRLWLHQIACMQTHHSRSTIRHGSWRNGFYGTQWTIEFSKYFSHTREKFSRLDEIESR